MRYRCPEVSTHTLFAGPVEVAQGDDRVTTNLHYLAPAQQPGFPTAMGVDLLLGVGEHGGKTLLPVRAGLGMPVGNLLMGDFMDGRLKHGVRGEQPVAYGPLPQGDGHTGAEIAVEGRSLDVFCRGRCRPAYVSRRCGRCRSRPESCC